MPMNEPSLAAASGTVLAIALLLFLLSGVIVGALARWVLPGADTMSIGRTILYGIGGSFVGGFVSRALGVSSTLVQLAIAVAAAAALIWFFTRRKPKATT
jgi:uncharacterized membrane protein YeaQ/YmgE (transglycosylase-associated protein family)